MATDNVQDWNLSANGISRIGYAACEVWERLLAVLEPQ
jgi:hypothetical protein